MITGLAEAIISEISNGLPGEEVQYRMAPETRLEVTNELPPVDAGVLILLYPSGETVCTVLIKRTDYQGVHSGQVSFPGGKHESGDRDIIATAIRETEEELGIGLENCTLVGSLTRLHIPVSNSTVYPHIACTGYRPAFCPDSKEVEGILEISLPELMQPACIRYTSRHILGRRTRVPYYDINNRQVWGATAMIISEFIELIKRSGHFPPG